jgi:hypothetical protein
MIPASAVVTLLVSRFGHLLWATWGGWATTILGSAVLISLHASIETFNWILILLAIGLGHGLLLNPLNLAAQAACDAQDAALATTTFAFVSGLGFSVGVALGGSIFLNALTSLLASARLPLGIAADATAFVLEIWKMPSGSEYHLKYVDVYAGALQTVFKAMAGFALLGGVVSLLIEPHSVSKELDSHPAQRKE